MHPFCGLLVNPLVVVGGSLHRALVGEDAEGFFLFLLTGVIISHLLSEYKRAVSTKLYMLICLQCSLVKCFQREYNKVA